MKKFLVLVLLTFFSFSSFSAESPYAPWVNDLLDDSRFFSKRQLKGSFDFDKVGGAQGSYNSGLNLPAGSTVTKSFLKVTKAFVDGGSGTVSIGCGSSLGLLYASADITGSSTDDFVAGVSDGSVSNFKTTSDACNIRVHLDGAAITEGKLEVHVEYIH